MGQRGRILGIIVADGDDSPLASLGEPGGPALTPFAGKYRFIDFALATLRNSGVVDVCVVTPFPAARLRAHLERALPGRRPRVMPLAGSAATRAGRLGAALRAAGPLWRDLGPDTIAILLADHILLCDLRPLLAAHAARAADVTLPALSLPASEIDGRVRLHTDAQGRVDLGARGSGGPAPFALTWAGDAVVRREVAAGVLDLSPSADECALRAYAAALRIDAYDVLASHGPAGSATGPYWHEPMSVEAYYGAQMELCTQRPPLDLYNPAWPLPTAAGGLAPAKLVADAAGRAGQALDSLVSDGSVIRGGVVVKSVLGHGVVVESGAEVEDSILLDGCRIGRGARVRRALIGAGAVIADEEEIGYGAAAIAPRRLLRSGLTVVPAAMR
jgi:glucose-1-phosphate adenylyltransferase